MFIGPGNVRNSSCTVGCSIHYVSLHFFKSFGVQDIADHFSIAVWFAGVCYGQFMAMRYKFNLVTYVQRALVVDRRGGTERNLNAIKAGSRLRKAVVYERDVRESK